MRSVLFYLFACCCLSANAQSPDKKPFERKGFIFGGAVGASYINLSAPNFSSEKQLGLSFPNLKFGKMITPRTALLLCLPGTVYRYKWSERERDRGFEAIVPAVQFWPFDRFWLLAGAGLGMDAPAFYDIKNEAERKFYFGGAALAGAGYQIFQHGRFALDVQGRVHFGNINTPDGNKKGVAFSLLVGFNFY
jgi:hypothetical protein